MPLSMDAFNDDGFSVVHLTESVNRVPTVPGVISGMNLFQPRRVRSHKVAVESKQGKLVIVQTSERGAPRNRRDNDKRKIVDLRTRRIDEASRITADEVSGIRAFGSETELKSLQTEVVDRQQMVVQDLQATRERLYLGAINGLLVDADDSTIYDFYDVFGFVRPSEIDFDWANRTGVREFIQANVTRPMLRALGGIAPAGARIIALCGDDFFDGLTRNTEYRERYKNNENASELFENHAFSAIEAFGVTWVNYRGTDDNSTVAIAPDKARFFMMGVPGLFIEAFAPPPTFGLVNTLGQEWYSRIIRDDKRDEWADVEVESHRVPICTRPESLLQGNG